jgi:poly-beta-hydroxybutyrate-responsive repressor
VDLDKCPCSGKHLAKLLRPALLALLARSDSHGYALVQDLGEWGLFANHSPDSSGVYRSLRELEKEEMVLSIWQAAENGPPRRIFTITDQGRECLEKWRSSLLSYQEQIEHLRAMIEKSTPGKPKTKGGRGSGAKRKDRPSA